MLQQIWGGTQESLFFTYNPEILIFFFLKQYFLRAGDLLAPFLRSYNLKVSNLLILLKNYWGVFNKFPSVSGLDFAHL